MKASGIGLVVLGMLLIVAAFLWPRLMPTENLWTDDQATEYSAAAAHYHNLSFQYANRTDQKSVSEVESAEEEYEQKRKQLDSALSWRAMGETLFRWTGIASSIAGACLLLVHRQQVP